MRKRERMAPVLLAVLALVLAPGRPVSAADSAAPPRSPAWPKTIRMGPVSISLDAPGAESFEETKLKAHGAVRVQRPEDAGPIAGTASYEAVVRVDRAARTVTLVSVEVPSVDLGGARPALARRVATRIGIALTRQKPRLPLDDVLAAVRLAGRPADGAPKLNNEPPRVLFETEPAILLTYDGAPRFRSVEGSSLERAMNTPFLVLHDSAGGAYYLSGGTSWFRAPDAGGPWSPARDVPPEAIRIAQADLRDAGVATSDVEKARKAAPRSVAKILVATEPTELIVSDGAPRWTPVVPGELETMTSSESEVFRTVSDSRDWVVLSGRWFRSDTMAGPWTYVPPDRLPEVFRKIPKDSPKASVLAYVPGTEAAEEAVADARRPRTAAVRRRDARLSVTYDGEPRFEAVPGTRVEYALNTSTQVLRIGGRYYACDQGIWFAADGPEGPWRVADSVPEDDIRAIPPESPVYNTRFVYVYDATPEVVYVAYTPAYLGSYPYYGAVVFGTGWFYRPWWGAYYYPRPWTWGFHAVYAPMWGWGYGFGWGPAWAGFRYGFGYGWGARWCGPGAFFRPAFRGAAFAGGMVAARGVAAPRSLYASGVNATRAVANPGLASRTASGVGGATRAGGSLGASPTRSAGGVASSRGSATRTSPTARGSSAPAPRSTVQSRGAAPKPGGRPSPKPKVRGPGGKGRGGKKP